MNPTALDHASHVRRAIDLAETAAERGDDPYGSLLVRDGQVVMEATNRVNTDDDIALHPELTLARRAASEHTPAERARTVMYTSTEPCPMCAAGIAYAGLGAVVYSVSGARAAEVYRGRDGSGSDAGSGSDDAGAGSDAEAGSDDGGEGIPCEEVFDRLGRSVEVVGPVLESEGLDVHRAQARE